MASLVWPLWTCSELVVDLHGKPILYNVFLYSLYLVSLIKSPSFSLSVHELFSIMLATGMKLMSLWKLELWMASLSWDAAWDSLVSCFCCDTVSKMVNTSNLYAKQFFHFVSPQDTTWTRRGWSRVCIATPGMTSPMCSQNTCPCNQTD